MVKLLLLSFIALGGFKANAQQKELCCRIKSGPVSLDVEQTSGKIVSFSFNGSDLILSKEQESLYYGATLWLSPQQNWWPVDTELDGSNYTLVSSSPTEIHIVSTPGKSGLQIEKIFSFRSDTAIDIRYRIRNEGLSEKKVGAWELIRTTKGTTFFPATPKQNLSQSNLQGITYKDGIAFYDFVASSNRADQKLFSGATEGWMAHLTDELLFVKVFPDLQPNQIAPGQGEVEIFVNAKGTYLELETHGIYTMLKPKQYLEYHVVWFIRPAPKVLNNRSATKSWADYVRTFLTHHDDIP